VQISKITQADIAFLVLVMDREPFIDAILVSSPNYNIKNCKVHSLNKIYLELIGMR
jgi:hypothetical protein